MHRDFNAFSLHLTSICRLFVHALGNLTFLNANYRTFPLARCVCFSCLVLAFSASLRAYLSFLFLRA